MDDRQTANDWTRSSSAPARRACRPATTSRGAGCPFADPRCGRTDRRPLAGPLGLAPAVQPGPLRLAPGHALPRARLALADGTRDGRLPRGVRGRRSTCPSGWGRASSASSPDDGGFDLIAVHADGRHPRRARSSSRPARSARPRSRTFAGRARPVDPAAPLAASTATRPSWPTVPVLVVGGRHSGRRHRVRGGRPAIGRSSPARPTASCRSGCSTRACSAVAGRRVRRAARAHDPHADGPAMRRPSSRGRRPAPSHPPIRALDRGRRAARGQGLGVRDGRPVLADGTVLDVANVIWATGYRPDYACVAPPSVGDDGWPIEDRGVSRRRPACTSSASRSSTRSRRCSSPAPAATRRTSSTGSRSGRPPRRRGGALAAAPVG